MVISELVQRSPIRVLDKAIHGGLKSGELGVIAAPSGIGKTSVLVQLALDKLVQDKKVIHISFNRQTDYVLVWYQDIFNAFIKKRNLQNEKDVKDDIEKNKVLMKFNQEGLSVEQILKSIRALIKDGGFNADALIIDGLDFSKITESHVATLKTFATEMGVSMWFSCTVKNGSPSEKPYDKRNIPLVIKDYAEKFAVILVMEPKQDNITMTVSKDRDSNIPEDLALKLDPKTLLILEQ
ncbi:MAG: AAA family ATPase [Treponema sp.]|nr:AAA family ATPase [Treponema sp.]